MKVSLTFYITGCVPSATTVSCTVDGCTQDLLPGHPAGRDFQTFCPQDYGGRESRLLLPLGFTGLGSLFCPHKTVLLLTSGRINAIGCLVCLVSHCEESLRHVRSLFLWLMINANRELYCSSFFLHVKAVLRQVYLGISLLLIPCISRAMERGNLAFVVVVHAYTHLNALCQWKSCNNALN